MTAERSLEVLVDSDAFNVLALNDVDLARVTAAVQAGTLTLRCSHLTWEEVAATPHSKKREALLRLPVSPILVPTVLPLDFGRLDMAASASDAAAAIYDHVQIGNLRHVEDAALIATAFDQGLVVVCVDARLTKACRRHGVPVMDPATLLASLPP